MHLRDLRRDSFALIREELRWRVAVVLSLLICLVMAILGTINFRLSTPDAAYVSWAILGVGLACLAALFRMPRQKGASVFFFTMALTLVAVMAYGMIVGRPMDHWAYIFPPVVAFLLRAGPALAAMLAFGIYAAVAITPSAPVIDVVRFASAYGLLVCFMYTYALLQEKAAVLLRYQSEHDALSGCLNRRRFNETIENLSSGRREADTCTILLIDIDHFKSINDRYGHLAGDRIIAGTAASLARALRENTLLFRYGGEEFAVLLLDVGIDEGLRLAERLRVATAEASIDGVSITVSIGVAQWRKDEGSLLAALDRADQALYEAKHAGRNCVISNPVVPTTGPSPDKAHRESNP